MKKKQCVRHAKFKPIANPPRLLGRTPRRRQKLNSRLARSAHHRSGISPLTTRKSGPGQGVVSNRRFSRSQSRANRLITRESKVRELNKTDGDWQFIVHFKLGDYRQNKKIMNKQDVEDFIKTSLSGPFKLVKHRKRRYVGVEVNLHYLKLEDESDLFTLMLCHRGAIYKVFKLIGEKGT